MREALAIILTVAFAFFLFDPSVLGENARAVVDGFTGQNEATE